MTERESLFGDILSQRRRAAGLTQDALAERAGISARAIAELERGAVRAPRRDTLEMIADALELDPDERERWRIRRRHLSIRDRPSELGDTIGSSLPIRATSLIGRERELDQLTETIRREDVRLLTITGPGGVGKTRLALEVGRALQGSFRHGVVFVELAAVQDPELVISTIAKRLGIRETSRTQIENMLLSRLSRNEAMLVVDNFEHVLDAAPTIANLIAGSGNSKFLITSRARLNLHSEFEFVLGALDLPDPDARVSRSVIAESPAVELFTDRAKRIHPDFQLTHENIDDVLAICRRVEGLPLALELAAARVKLLSPRAMAPRLTNRLAFLTGGFQDGPDRHLTMRHAIAWSFELLEPEEKHLLLQLSVFVGGWTLEAAEWVAPTGADVVGLLSSLVDNSLIHRIERDDGEPRFGMLETIREFAIERLRECGQFTEAKQAHARYVLDLAERSGPNLFCPDHQAWEDAIAADLSNIRAALDWLHGDGDDPYGNLRLASALVCFLPSYGYVAEGRQRLSVALEQNPERSLPRMKALAGASWLANYQNDVEDARRHATESLELAAEFNNDWFRGWALHVLGRTAFFENDPASARNLGHQSLEIARELDDHWLIAWAYQLLAMVDHFEGNLHSARSYYEASLELRRGINYQIGVASTLGMLGMLAYSERDYQLAQQQLSESLRLIYQLDARSLYLNVLATIVGFAAHVGEAERAARLAGFVSELSNEVGAGPIPIANEVLHEGLKLTRAALDSESYEDAFNAGTQMRLEDVVEEVLQMECCS